jgi:DNA replication protein DnaC
MIFSNDCFVKDICKKRLSNNCECATNNIFCIKLFKLDNLYDNAMLSNAQRQHLQLRIDADGSDKDAFNRLKYIEDNIEEFVNSSRNLYIYSHITGNGKSAWAVRLLQSYFNSIWHSSELTCRGLYINVPRFLLSLKDNISEKSDYIQHIKEYILEADLVIWDELGYKNVTPFEAENLLNYINARIDLGKSNIYTSNMYPEELREKVGDRLYSRVVNLSENIMFVGSDKRALNI